MMCNMGLRPLCHIRIAQVQMSVHIRAILSGHSLFVDIYTIVIDCVSGQRRPRSACAFAQADQGLHCPQIM